ncbi:MAG: SRPBCC family protein, partial [Candidatus Dormibacteraceae bacterium]
TMTRRKPDLQISVLSQAAPEAVYDVLADLRTHLDWSGSRQFGMFRLLALEAPAGAAQVGTVFHTSGTIPMSARQWSDRSTVTVADRPRTFEFVTEATAGDNGMTARNEHRYEIRAAGSGSRITYTFAQLAAARPMLRLVLPVMGWMTWRFAIPMFVRRTLRNLAAVAEERSQVARSTARVADNKIQMHED